LKLYLGSYLSWYLPHRPGQLEIHLDSPIALIDLVTQLKLPSAEIAIAAVNGTLVSIDNAQISDEDHVELHPPNGGG
jgi:sulfur carrier protein ThiS